MNATTLVRAATLWMRIAIVISTRSDTFYMNSRLTGDHSNGAVEIYVRDTMGWMGPVQVAENDTSGMDAATVVGYYGDYPMRLYTSFIGTVVAPNTSVELYDNQAPYYGASTAST